MLFNKSLLILGSLVGVSALGGYFGASALDSHFSQQSESPENQKVLNQPQGDASRNPGNDNSENRDTLDTGQSRREGGELSFSEDSLGRQGNSDLSDSSVVETDTKGDSGVKSPEGTVSDHISNSEDTDQARVTGDNDGSGLEETASDQQQLSSSPQASGTVSEKSRVPVDGAQVGETQISSALPGSSGGSSVSSTEGITTVQTVSTTSPGEKTPEGAESRADEQKQPTVSEEGSRTLDT